MKFGKKSAGAVAAGLSLAMALTGFAPAVALAEQPATPTVEKIVQLNNGSTVDATFTFEAEPTVLFEDTDNETETHTVAATIGTDNTIEVEADGSKAENKAEKSISFGAFNHAGVYAWTVTEESSSAEDGKGTFQNNTENKTYTLVAVVDNPTTAGGAYTVSSYQVWDGVPTASEVNGKIQYSANDNAKKSDKATFTNKYTEEPDETENGVDLKVKKTVTGAQGDKSKLFKFVVTFTAPDIVPSSFNGDKDAYLAGIDASGAPTEVTGEKAASWAADTAAHTRTYTFYAHDAQEVNFDHVIAGTTYTVTEPDDKNQNGYTTTGDVTTATPLADNAATTVEVKNEKSSTVVTGVIMNNAPFIVMIGAAAAGVAAYGSAKRKLEK